MLNRALVCATVVASVNIGLCAAQDAEKPTTPLSCDSLIKFEQQVFTAPVGIVATWRKPYVIDLESAPPEKRESQDAPPL